MIRDISILVVDDLEAMRMSVCSILKHLGFSRVLEAPDGHTALAMIRSNPVGLVITDLDMPGMDGLELLQAVRADAVLKDLPVLFMTGEAEKTRVLEAAQAGVNDYVLKPFTVAVLDQKIRTIFGLNS
ncbi:MAG: response regulator [Deltaproteobacteria bacterium]|nr:response regulator [Deltaproteobacteria bacterium]